MKIFTNKILKSKLEDIVWDTTIDYNEGLGEFYAKDDIDHKVYLHNNQAAYADPDTGQIKVDWK